MARRQSCAPARYHPDFVSLTLEKDGAEAAPSGMKICCVLKGKTTMFPLPSQKTVCHPAFCGIAEADPEGVFIDRVNAPPVAFCTIQNLRRLGTMTVCAEASVPLNTSAACRTWLGPRGGALVERSSVPPLTVSVSAPAMASSKIWNTELLALLPHTLLSLPVPMTRYPSNCEKVSAGMSGGFRVDFRAAQVSVIVDVHLLDERGKSRGQFLIFRVVLHEISRSRHAGRPHEVGIPARQEIRLIGRGKQRKALIIEHPA